MAADAPKTKDIRLRFRGEQIAEFEQLTEAAGRAIGHPDEAEVVILAALKLYAGTLGVR